MSDFSESFVSDYSERQTVLVVDDTPSNIEVLYGVLAEYYRVLFATNGPRALEIAAKATPDIILLDIMMPQMDGYEVCRQLKSQAETKHIPIVFVTAKDQEADEEIGLKMGAVDYLTKPIRPAITLWRIRNQLELKRHRDLLSQMALLDGLTGIANRRRFDERLPVMWRRAVQDRTPVSLILLDIDHFKRFNDVYGHTAGDDCLRAVGREIGMAVNRPQDLAARYGGEEFACILDDLALEAAESVAENIRSRVIGLGIPHAQSPGIDFVTVSLGVASRQPDSEDRWDDLIEAADAALYQAKKQGRNRVIAWDERIQPVQEEAS